MSTVPEQRCDGITCIGLERLAGEMHTGFAQNTSAIEAAVAANVVAAQGVANFRAFQLEVSKKIAFVHGAVWVVGAMSFVVVGILSWALSIILPAAKLVVDDYYRNHPAAVIQHTQAQPVTARYTAPPQDAQIPRNP